MMENCLLRPVAKMLNWTWQCREIWSLILELHVIPVWYSCDVNVVYIWYTLCTVSQPKLKAFSKWNEAGTLQAHHMVVTCTLAIPSYPLAYSGLAFLCVCASYTLYFFCGQTNFNFSLLLCILLGAQVFSWVKYSMKNHCWYSISVSTKHHNIPIKHPNIPIARDKCVEVF